MTRSFFLVFLWGGGTVYWAHLLWKAPQRRFPNSFEGSVTHESSVGLTSPNGNFTC